MGGVLKIILRHKDAQTFQAYLQNQVTKETDIKILRSQEKWTLARLSLRNEPNTTITITTKQRGKMCNNKTKGKTKGKKQHNTPYKVLLEKTAKDRKS